MWKIGELAQQMGVTVRTLHHYDAQGLLKPSSRSMAGYRLYDEADAVRLGHILLLRRLGLSLDEIGACLDAPEHSLERTISAHIERLRAHLEAQQAILDRLEALEHHVHGRASSVDQLQTIMEVMDMIDKYYTQEQLEALERRREAIGEDAIEAVQQEWTVIFEGFADALARGLAPDDDEVAALARRSRELIAMFTGGDPGISASLNTLYQQEGGPDVLQGHGYPIDEALWEFMGRARAALPDEA